MNRTKIEVSDGIVNEGDIVFFSSSILLKGEISYVADSTSLRFSVVNLRDYLLAQQTAKEKVFIDKRKAEMYHKLKK